MPIVSEAARRADSGSSGFGRRGGWSPSSSTMVPGSDSRAAVLQCDEMEESDGEVQSSYRGPFETMEALQDALPSNRKRVSKFYNGESSSNVAGAAQLAQATASPGNPSPKKRKGFLSFSFSWTKSRSRGSSSSRRAPSPAPASSSQGHSGRANNEHARRWLQRSSSTRAAVSTSPAAAAALRSSSSQLIAVQMQAVCLEDVAESTASLCPREKRRRSLQ
ncbi:uncharacterized protein LOC120701837 [Panicum virgatum]|uniref:Uncharacterized protein n=1 Tax=Panicum virgatum TaxID=38727 RepID=A0A8T0TME5_PANVG|nr:uncharacterized protein LOC120701837 [Panicum virgatum]KAG2610183.1 hypothetical protein PVAP13_4KG183600 [Panicum virgatum]